MCVCEHTCILNQYVDWHDINVRSVSLLLAKNVRLQMGGVGVSKVPEKVEDYICCVNGDDDNASD